MAVSPLDRNMGWAQHEKAAFVELIRAGASMPEAAVLMGRSPEEARRMWAFLRRYGRDVPTGR